LLAGEADDVTRFRRIGIAADAVVEGLAADPPTLFERELDRPGRLEHAMDQIRAKLGDHSVRLGRSLPTADASPLRRHFDAETKATR
jgi:hypothetical protein